MTALDNAELNDLVKIFQTLQREEVVSQVTERNVVDIVNILVKKKLIELVYTSDGKEYLTQNALKQEIIDEVYVAGGRLNVVDLPGLLSVHPQHVEHALPEVLKEAPNLHFEANELMTDMYLSKAVQNTADVLNEQGCLSVTQFASRHQLSSTFALDLLTRAVQEGRLNAIIQNSVLYTKRYVRLQKKILRSGLLAVTQPVDLATFHKRHGLFALLLDILISDLRDQMPGVFHAYTYTPFVYEQYRIHQIENIYKSNGYIEYATLHSMGITNPKHYLLSRYNPNDATSEASPRALTTEVDSQRRSRKKKAGNRSSQKNAKETTASIVRASEAHPLCGYLLSACFLSDRYLFNLISLQPIAEAEVAAVNVAQMFPDCVDLQKDWVVLRPRLCELFCGLDKCDLIEGVVLLREDFQQKIKPLLLSALELKGKPIQSGKGINEKLAQKWIMEILSDKLELNLEQYENVLSEILGRWNNFVQEVLEHADYLRENNAASEAKELRQCLIGRMSNAWVELTILAKGIQWAKGQLNEDTYAALNRYALGAKAFELCRDVVLNESLDDVKLVERVRALLGQVTHPSNLQKAIAPFPENERIVLMPILDALKGRELATLTDVLQRLSGTGSIAIASFHPPNKKLERETYARMKAAVIDKVQRTPFIDSAVANGALFAALCTILVHCVFHVHIVVPGKIVRDLVARLSKEANVPPGITTVYEIVSTALQRNEVDFEDLKKLNSFRDQVLGYLPG